METPDRPLASEEELDDLTAASAAANAESVRRRSAAAQRRLMAKKRRWRTLGYGVSAVLCVFSAAVGTILGNISLNSKAGGSVIKTIGLQMLKHPTDPLGGYNIDQQFPSDKQTYVNVLLLGCDVDYEPGRPVELKKSRGRSDSIMIARMDYVNKTIHVLSIPRDTAVQIPGHGIKKINSANAYQGPELLAEVIKDTFGIDTDFYVSLNFDTFKTLVDQIGGVDVTVEKDLDYDDNWGNLHIHLKKGYQHLTGYQAMGFVRMRHSDDDLHRAARQHAFMEAMRTQVKSVSTLNKLPELINTVFGDVTTNLTNNQLISLALWTKSVPKENVVMETMPSIEGHSYVAVNREKAEEVVSRLFFDNKVPVTINAPLMSMVDSMATRGRRKKGKGAAAAGAQKTDNGSDDPLDTIMDDPTTPASVETSPPASSGPGKEGVSLVK
jgi:polyisoprenyl-teichoic acid--peptidoglycan teichoic acid transferase